MAVQQGTSLEWIELKEDEIAQMITAREQVDQLRRLLEMLQMRGALSPALYNDSKDSLDHIAGALLIGKRNTGILRNGH